MPSILEWIIYGLITLIAVIFMIVSIYKKIDRRKHPEKYQKEDDDE